MSTTVGDDIQVQIKRVRDEVIPIYESIGAPGTFAVAMMKQTLDQATKALAEGDIIAILRVYEELKDCQC